MSRIKNSNTKPELFVRKLIYSMGYRYRLHKKNLPGHPDMVFSNKRKVIFIHGCFWHQHECKHYVMPRSRIDFWQKKLIENKNRDKRNNDLLLKYGWDILIIWECELKEVDSLSDKIRVFLEKKNEGI